MQLMSFDDLMFVMIIAGVVLSGAHLHISFRRWRLEKAAALRRETAHRNLQVARLTSGLTGDPS